MSQTAMRLSAPWYDAFSIASQTDPSAISESPSSTHARAGFRSRRIASAIPSPIGSPWPSDPVATSMCGMSGRGTG
jgi:hypothetical protein